MGDAVVTKIFETLGWSSSTVSRVTSIPAGDTNKSPKSGVQMYKKYAAMTSMTKAFSIESGFIGTVYTLIFCTLINGNDDSCTDNIWADLMLNGGSFEKTDIFYWLNLFTW